MKQVYLIRTSTSDQGTFGHLLCGDSHWWTGELPWKDNQPNLSCIPEGTYTAHYRADGKHGPCYELENVPGRKEIQIHVGNWCGDTEQGYHSDVLGCILLGKGRSRIKPHNLESQEAVAQSTRAIKELLDYMELETVNLHVEDKIT